MTHVVHAGLSWTSHSVNTTKLQFIFEPFVGIYYPTIIFKDKALCGTRITIYHMEVIYVDDAYDIDVETGLIAISYRPGQRPIYYTDISQIPRCVQSSVKLPSLEVSCMLCKNNHGYGLWELQNIEL